MTVTYRTICPQCASVFRVGADQLGAAQGWVQCGVCGAAFDAHPNLLTEDGSPPPRMAQPEAEAEPVAPPPPESSQADEQEADEAASPPDTAVAESTPEPPPPAEELPAAVPRGIAQRETSLDLPSIILIDPNIPVSDDLGPLPQFHTASAYPPPLPGAATAPTRPVTAPAARIEYAAPLRRDAARILAASRHPKPWVWGASSVLLLALLIAQTGYFLRDAMVSRLPWTRPAFERACAVLGCTLSLPKNLALLQIVGSDLQSEASGRLRLTLTLGNRANQAQVWPVLLLTLTDQRNRPLARRSFAPSEYLGDAQRIAAGIPPRSEQALSLPLTVHDLAPMGFGLQLAY